MVSGKRWLVAAGVLAMGALARADLLEEVQKQVAPVLTRRQAAEQAASREAEAQQKKALTELEKAQKQLKEAQARLDRIAEEAKRAEEKAQAALRKVQESAHKKVDQAKQGADERAARAAQEKAQAEQAKKEATQKKETASSMTQAARELELAAAAVARGEANVDEKLTRAKEDANLKQAAHAVAGMAAFLRKDDARVAAELTDEVVTAFPSSRRYRGLSRLRQKDDEGAWKDLKAAALPARDLEAQLALARLAQKRKDVETARQAFGAAFAADPANAEAALGLARALFDSGHPADARAPLQAIATPADRETSYMLAVAHDRAGDGAHAQVALAQALKVEGPRAARDPSYAKVHRPLRVVVLPVCWQPLPPTFDEPAARARLACWDLAAGDHDGARKLVAGASPGAEGLFVRGLAERRAGKLKEARAALEAAMQADPSRKEPKQALAVVLLEAGDADKARALVEAMDDPAAKLTHALALAELGKKADAEAMLAKLSGGAVDDAAATDLAALRHAAGRADAAKVLPAKPATPEGWLLGGVLAAARGDHKTAVAWLRSAVDAQPNFVDAWVELAHALEAAGDHAGAKDAAKKALEISPDLVEARAILGRVLGREGDTAGQAHELQRIRELGDELTAAAGGRHALAVLAFENHSGDPSLDWLQLGVAEALVSDLGRLGALTLVERTQVQKGFAELRFQELGFTDPATAAKVGKVIGADVLLVGQIVKDGGQVRLDGRVIQASGGKVLKTGSASGTLAQIFDIERRLALDLLGDYAAVTERERHDLLAAKKPSVQTLERMSRVRMLSSAGKAREAKEAYERLVKEDPKAAAQLAELQKSWADVAATVAVLPLQNLAGRSEDAWLGVGIAESLATDLKKVGLFLVERQQIEKLMQERRFTEIMNEQQAVSLGKLAGATMLVLGSYQVQGEYLRIDARLVEVATAQVMQTWTVEGKRAALFDAENRLVRQVAEALKVEPAQVEKAQLAAGKPSLDDFKRYIQASSKLVVKPAAAQAVSVQSLAVGRFQDAAGGADPAAALGVRRALERNTRAPVRASDASEPREANADALVLGTLTRLGDTVKVDARAVLSSTGEVVASATSVGPAAQLDGTEEQVARNLLTALGLRGAPMDKTAKKPLYKQWWLWTTVAVAVGGSVAAGVVLGTQKQILPAADSTIIVR